MRYIWRTSCLSPDYASSLEGKATQSSYKYNSLLVLSLNPDHELIYHYPRHNAGAWIKGLKGTVLTINAIGGQLSTPGSDDDLSPTSLLPPELPETHINSPRGASPLKDPLFTFTDNLHTATIEIDGGPVYCTLYTTNNLLYIITSDSCESTGETLKAFTSLLPILIPDSLNCILTPTASTNIIDSFVDPLLDLVGSNEYIPRPLVKPVLLSPDITSQCLDSETHFEFDDTTCYTCGGIYISFDTRIVYSSLPSECLSTVNNIVSLRRLNSVSEGYVIWFNELQGVKLSEKDMLPQQGWYILLVSKQHIVVVKLLNIIGEPSVDVIMNMAGQTEGFIYENILDLKQELPSDSIKLKYVEVLSYQVEGRHFGCEQRYSELVQFYHGVGGREGYMRVEGEEWLGQCELTGKGRFTVCYKSKGIHDVGLIYKQLGLN